MSFPGIFRRLFTNNGAGPLLRGDIIPPSYGTCSTAAGTAAKTVSIPGITLKTGVEITVRFSVTNTAANPTLNLNSTGAKAIRYRNTAISAGYLAANRTYRFVYDGTYWQLVGDVDTNTTYTAATAAPKAPGTAAVGTSAKYAREDHVHPVQTSVSGSSGSCTGNAATATKMATARTVLVNLASTTAASFDGTKNVTPGVSGTLPVGRGGTGRTDGKAVALATKRTISLTGDATGSVGFDGSANAAIPASIPALVPVGGIVAFSGTFSGRNPVDMKSEKAMTNWCLCDVSGTVGETTLTKEQMPTHNHKNADQSGGYGSNPSQRYLTKDIHANTFGPSFSDNTGGSQPHTHSLSGAKSGSCPRIMPWHTSCGRSDPAAGAACVAIGQPFRHCRGHDPVGSPASQS